YCSGDDSTKYQVPIIKVEHVEKDKEKAASSADKFDKLEWIQERMRDDFAANQALRRSFKHEKASLKERRIRDEDLLKRMSLNIELASESAEDKKLAAAVLRYKKMKFTIIFLVSDEQVEEKRKAILNKPIFSSNQPSTSTKNDVTQKRLLSMKLHRKERNAFDNVSPTNNGQEQIKTENLGIIKRLKCENEEHDEIDILNKVGNLDDVKPGNAELLYPVQMNLRNIKDEFVSDVKPDLSRKPLALVADYSGDSSSDSAD
ncbi:unnamed protein product, partial [Onchocerca flexuosa]|uniref:NAM-associated domain-containing protein n=1 Tax=Onchocerca flexuosa TaxID=387005 RepID=A0A183HL03_9BILA